MAFEAIGYMKKTVSDGDKISIPVLLLQAGKDKVVSKHGQDQFADRVRDIKKFQFQDSFHEILMEKEDIREKAFKMILNFLKNI